MITKAKNFIAEKKNAVLASEKRKHGGKEIIMEFALAAIAVVLAMLFRDQIEDVISTLGTTFSTKINSIFTSNL
ncbi:MAG: hypothetical protein E7267_03710 [Lachnospiraceae bacterium]|nr:hypothetical protein [Lachnospiraceae bacterium]